MNVSRIQPTGRNRSPQIEIAHEATEPGPASTALIPVAAATAARHTASRYYRPDPAFVAHLIAIAQQAPQTRNLRRASSHDAHGHYKAARLANAAASGLSLSRLA